MCVSQYILSRDDLRGGVWLFGRGPAGIDIVGDVRVGLSNKETAPGTTRAGLSKSGSAPHEDWRYSGGWRWPCM